MALSPELDAAVLLSSDQPEELWRHPHPWSTQMHVFLKHVNTKYGLRLLDYSALSRWSVDNLAAFWEETWHFVGITASKPYDEVGDGP